ncbi:MAG: DinB family protein [Rhodomicrobiaceae bacterium]
MIGVDYARTMARYNAWQNRSLYREADRLTDEKRREDRGAFFRSIHGTLAHILWGDMMWMARLDGWEKPAVGPADGETWMEWGTLKAERADADRKILDWAGKLDDADLTGDLTWYSGVYKRNASKPKWIVIAHFYNHQTHHRGQAHALLTSFGMTPDATDLGFMPDDV